MGNVINIHLKGSLEKTYSFAENRKMKGVFRSVAPQGLETPERIIITDKVKLWVNKERLENLDLKAWNGYRFVLTNETVYITIG